MVHHEAEQLELMKHQLQQQISTFITVLIRMNKVILNLKLNLKKMLGEIQTLRAGCSKVEPKIFAHRRPPSRGHRMARI